MNHMIPKSSKYHPEDADTLKVLARAANLTISEFINLCVGRVAIEAGYPWHGKQSRWGDAARFAVDSDRAEVNLRGLPPLVDDD